MAKSKMDMADIMKIRPYVEKKKSNGNTYYQLARKAWINGRSERVWSKYLGTAEKIEKVYDEHENCTSLKLKSYEYGRTAALMKIAEELNFVEIVNKHTSKKKMGGLTVGEYMLLVILSRADEPVSKNGISDWFDESFLSLIWSFSHKLNTQNFTNHMEYLTDDVMRKIGDDIGKILVELGLVPTKLYIDMSNVFTYIENGEKLPKKGKSKEKRYDKNIIGIGIATSDENIPILHESYPGNKHDSKVFGEIFMKIVDRLNKINVPCKGIVAVWDKGCNSEENIGMVKDSEMNVVGALRKDQVPELYDIPLDKYDYLYTNKKKHEVKGYRITKEVFGHEYTIVMSYNEGSYKKQSNTYEKKKVKILEELEKIKQSVERVGKGRKKSIKNALIDASKVVRNYEGAFKYDGYEKDSRQVFEYSVDADGEKELRATFGKNPIFTDKHEWDSEKIVKTYNQKDFVEKDFKWLKSTRFICIKPIYLSDDDHIKVHIFLCVAGLVFYRYMMWKLRKQNETLSETKIIDRLEKIRIAVVKKNDGNPKLKYEDMDLDQMRLFSTFELESVLKNVNF
ncbi:MAG: hypothetical protein A7316_08630 [Candidatus Altiarchaeales archaeon WOR_SM1_86-2]|nr:MAG: hypothetical protein A7316_08630 [Candidatus Altiarchaeales archaeon WOR_SM1_86-2]ODS40025.1 MAG: hypothetical protein A7315_09970 [Candidatus Altiarchaeales archaeon WOR_SM1_79]